MHDVRLVVDGQRLTGWKTFDLVRSIEAIAGAFAVTTSDRVGFPVPEGSAVEVQVEGETVLSGWIDSVRPSFDKTSRSVAIAGRDRTADLVDCSPLESESEYSGLSIDGLATEIARPFGIQVVTVADPGPVFERFAIQPGETAFEALDRAARLRGVLLSGDGAGGLLIDRPASARAGAALVEGENLLGGSGAFDRSGRFRRYVVRGAQAGSDLIYGDDLRSEAEAFDDAIRKTRGIVILAEGSADPGTSQRRAEWEATVRRARGSALTVNVQGFRQGPGLGLWRPNLLARVRSSTLRVDRDLLVSGVRFRLDAQGGSTTSLELVGADAFQRRPVLERESDLADELADPEDV